MFRRSFSGMLAAVCLLASIPAVPSAAADSYTMQVEVDLGGERKEISPYIYGVNEYTSSNLKTVTVHSTRQGGNRYTGYNWETNWSNAGSDWQHSSDTNIGDVSDGPAFAAQQLSKTCVERDIPYKLATLQLAGYVSADKAGTVTEAETAPSDRWNKVEFRKNGALSLEPDLTDGVVYMDEYVNYLVNKLGDASTETGIQAYSLDNEPVLWNDTHSRLHPEEVSNSELVSKSIELAQVVKEIDPKAEVFGPAFWGMLPCINAGSGDTFTDPDWEAVKGNYTWYLDYYLDQMAQAEKEAGKRLLDVVDVHYYAQDCSTDEAILQAARSLYDPTYVENSWLQPYFGQYFPFLPNIQASIDKYYPGTKIAISEYNLANIANEKDTGMSVVSAIAEAEALGCFADNGVYFATYWGTLANCPYAASAINLYTNYDGEGDDFGDTLVAAKTEDVSKAYAYAAIDGDDESEVTMVLSNKDMTQTESAEITLTGTKEQYQSAVVYAITQEHSDIRVIDVQNDLSGNKLTVELPPLSVAQIVLSDGPTDETLYEAPDITIKETTYQFSELKKSVNGFPMIPLGDKTHLEKIVINATVASDAGSAYGGGGGALCFNQVVPDGKTAAVWGNKAFSFALGTNDIEVLFDDIFTVSKDAEAGTSEDVEGVTLDDYTELQGNWWTYSEKDESGADISVTYNSVTLVYEYDNGNGDVNEDGALTLADLVAFQKWLLADGTKLADPEEADMEPDGVLDVFDLAKMKFALLKLK